MKNMGRLAVMGALSLSLVACGGNAATSAVTSTASASATSTTSTVETAPAVKTVVGTWKIAAFEKEGILMGGNLTELLGRLGLADSEEAASSLMEVTFNDGGTGSFSMVGETYDITWVETATGATMTPVATDDNPEPETVTITLEIDGLYMDMEGTMAIFTADGSYDGLESYDLSAATDVTAMDQIVGNWELTGMDMLGITMKGDPQAIADQMDLDDPLMTVNADGSVKVSTKDATVEITEEGAIFTDAVGDQAKLKMLDGELALDMGEAYNMELALIYAKK